MVCGFDTLLVLHCDLRRASYCAVVFFAFRCIGIAHVLSLIYFERLGFGQVCVSPVLELFLTTCTNISTLESLLLRGLGEEKYMFKVI